MFTADISVPTASTSVFKVLYLLNLPSAVVKSLSALSLAALASFNALSATNLDNPSVL